jgi:hypothetical protein
MKEDLEEVISLLGSMSDPNLSEGKTENEAARSECSISHKVIESLEHSQGKTSRD